MKKLFRIRNVFIILIAFILVLIAIFLIKQTFLTSKRELIIGTVKKGELIQRVTIAGEVVPNRSTFITAPYNGYIKKIYVKIGDKLKEGNPIVSISQTLDFSDRVFPIRAPFDGTVVHIEKMEGEYVYANMGSSDDCIVRMDDVSRLFVNAKVPEIDIVKIKKGQDVLIKATAILDRQYHGIITEISLASLKTTTNSWRDSTSANFPIKVEITDKDEVIKPGMTVTIDVVTNRLDNVLLLGQEYLYQKDDEYFVYLEDGQRRDVKTGLSNEVYTEIKEGLREGDRVRQYDFTQLVKDMGNVRR
ncbi:MAG: efflux RND transporter periplasmic adaptor subunit [Oligoflexia bacterium]|nr:efflux RND transporter periplasmic adaptor subunit [Oligoflexia bacterium]